MDSIDIPLRHRYATEVGRRHTDFFRGLLHVVRQVFKSPRKAHPGAISRQSSVEAADEFVNIPNVKT